MPEGFKIADAYVEVEAEIDRRAVLASAQDAGDAAGETMGERVTAGIGDRLRDDRGRFARSGRDAGAGLGESMGSSAGRTFGNVLSGHLPTIFSNPYVLGAAAAAGALLAPAIGAGLAGGLLGAAGLGVIAGGIALVAKDVRIQSAARDLQTSLLDIDLTGTEKKLADWRERLKAARKSGNEEAIAEARRNVKALSKDLQQAAAFNAKNTSLRDMAGVFVGPAVRALGIFEKSLDRIKPKIGAMFASMARSGAVESLATGLVSLVENALPGMMKMVDAAGPFLKSLAPGFAELGKGFSSFFTQIGMAGPDAAVFFADLFRWLAGVISFTGATIRVLAAGYTSMRNFFTSIPGWVSAAGSFFAGLWSNIVAKGSAAAAWIGALPGRFAGWFGGILAVVNARGSAMVGWFAALPGRIGAALATLPARFRNLFVSAWNLAGTAFGYGIGMLVRHALTTPGRLIGAMVSFGTRMRTLFMTAWQAARVATMAGIVAVVGFMVTLPGRAHNAIIGLVGRIRSVFSSARSAATSTASSLVSGVVSTLLGLPGRSARAVAGFAGAVTGQLRSAIGAARGIGADIIRGLIGGINSMVGAAASAARSAVGNVISGAKSALGIGSPSKVMASEVGRWLMPGLTQGMESTVPAARRAVAAATASLVPGATGAGVPAGTGALSGSGGGPVYNFAPGSIVIDASSLRSMADLISMIERLQPSARAMRARTAPVGA
jgi:phage-related protein